MSAVKAAVKGALTAAFGAVGYSLHLSKRASRQDPASFDRNDLSWHFNRDRHRRLYEEGLERSGVGWSDNFSKRCRHYGLMQLVERAARLAPDADAAECGCWKGHSTYIISSLLAANGFRGKLHVFDSFEGGLSDLSPEDKNERFELTAAQIAEQKALFASTEEEVRRALAGFDFVTLYKGWIPERFDAVRDRRFSFVHVDVDLYAPIRKSLEFFYPRLIDGGILVVDDYGFTQFPGAKKATDEFLRLNRPSFFYEVPTGGAFLIK
jgi:hypothetical protein